MSNKGVDSLLNAHGKPLKSGQEVRFTLVKGPSFQPVSDPVKPTAAYEQFPLIAKFPESVVKPNLMQPPWNEARLYQQDVPKAQEDSDEEDTSANAPAKKRWRRRPEAPKRQWILQEQVDFLQTMMAKRQRKEVSARNQISTRYEGIPEHNSSQYVLLETMPNESIQVTILPTPNATITFSQPATRKTLSMSEAEQAIQDQRNHMTRFMMHDKQRLMHSGNPTNNTKTRLFGKLSSKAKADADGEEDDDDIMGDLAFRNRKGGGKARKELLSSLGGDGLKVDADGVIGGANDSEFGRGRKFGVFKADKSDQPKNASDGQGGGKDGDAGKNEESTRGNDGLAMADDFYQRDVQAEYQELDFDANEQFDDDDVDVGETEVVVETSGFGDDDDEEDVDENEFDADAASGAEGLATVAGFRLMLAKARGEITPEQAAEAAAAGQEKQADDARRQDAYEKSRRQDEPDDHLAQIMAAAEKSAQAAKHKAGGAAAASADGNDDDDDDDDDKPSSGGKPQVITGNEVDENGKRLVTLEALRKEIWLHHGTIPMKRLMKIFDIKKKSSQERQNKFREVVRELCKMETDKIGRRMLVLKQHYSNMG